MLQKYRPKRYKITLIINQEVNILIQVPVPKVLKTVDSSLLQRALLHLPIPSYTYSKHENMLLGATAQPPKS
jgi:hypothetical protein